MFLWTEIKKAEAWEECIVFTLGFSKSKSILSMNLGGKKTILLPKDHREIVDTIARFIPVEHFSTR